MKHYIHVSSRRYLAEKLKGILVTENQAWELNVFTKHKIQQCPRRGAIPLSKFPPEHYNTLKLKVISRNIEEYIYTKNKFDIALIR